MIREHWEERFRKRLELSRSKEEDYGSEDIPNANFHRVAELCRILKVDITKPEGVTLFHITHKLDRVCNLLLDGRMPNNESVEDTLADMQNYIDILQDIREERNAGPAVKFYENYANSREEDIQEKEKGVTDNYIGVGMTCEEFPDAHKEMEADPGSVYKHKYNERQNRRSKERAEQETKILCPK